MKYPTFISIFILLLIFSFRNQKNVEGKFNNRYSVGEIPNAVHFYFPNEKEVWLDSVMAENERKTDSLVQSDKLDMPTRNNNYLENRARMVLTSYTNGMKSAVDEEKIGEDGLSVSCQCKVVNDTLMINAGIGFYGGMGFLVKVYDKQFKSSFYSYMDNVMGLKTTPDSDFTSNIEVDSKYQYLQLESPPNFESEEQVTGYLAMRSKEFYEKGYGDTLDISYVEVKLHFTCLPKV